MLLQKLILKYRWPLLRFIRLEKIGGVYSRCGEDVLILKYLYSHIVKSNNRNVIEINKPEDYPYSLTNVLLEMANCSSLLVNTKKRLVLSYAKEHASIESLSAVNSASEENVFGVLDSSDICSQLYKYQSNDQLINCIGLHSSKYAIGIVTTDSDSISLLKQFLSVTKIYAIFVIGNNKGSFSCGDHKIRNVLAENGFSYYVRLNGKHDFFVLSETCNGFPSSLYKDANMGSLQRWVDSFN
jgi:hypothetical protein